MLNVLKENLSYFPRALLLILVSWDRILVLPKSARQLGIYQTFSYLGLQKFKCSNSQIGANLGAKANTTAFGDFRTALSADSRAKGQIATLTFPKSSPVALTFFVYSSKIKTELLHIYATAAVNLTPFRVFMQMSAMQGCPVFRPKVGQLGSFSTYSWATGQ